MSIMLGNLSADQIVKRLGIIDMPSGVITEIENGRQERVDIPLKAGKWHCFDLPFTILCADMDTATSMYNRLKDCKITTGEQLKICVQ